MRLAILGGCGFIGSNLAVAFLKKADEIFLLDNLSSTNSYINLQKLLHFSNISFKHIDIRVYNELESILVIFNPDVIFHCVALVQGKNAYSHFTNNVLTTVNVVDLLCSRLSSTFLVYFSSNIVYGCLTHFSYKEERMRYSCLEFTNGFDELLNLEPPNSYAVSKLSADLYVTNCARQFNLNTVVVRLGSVYGGFQASAVDHGWVGYYCNSVLSESTNNVKINIIGNGKNVRDVLHIKDLQILCMRLLDHMHGVKGEVFNIGGGPSNSLSILELLAFITQECNIEFDYNFIDTRADKRKVFITDNSKALSMLYWQPQVSYERGIKKILKDDKFLAGVLSAG